MAQFGTPPPDVAPLTTPVAATPGAHMPAEAPSPISIRLPPLTPSRQNFYELAPPGAGSFPDDDAIAAEDAERGGAPGNRWPRQETLALLKIRLDMDAAFQNTPLKGPVWEDVSRKLAEQGYLRNAKKCKEKFENVHKYYKRTKEGRAGRQDGKTYRFFSQLEALHATTTTTNPAPPTTTTTTTAATMVHPINSFPALSPSPSPAAATIPTSLPATTVGAGSNLPSYTRLQPPPLTTTTTTTATAPAGINFSSDTYTSSSSDSEDEEVGDGGASIELGQKRKREGGNCSRKMMAFFEGLMKRVMERQESMQQRFMESIDKRENDRMIREEAWKRQEMARLSREHDLLAQERAMAAARDTAVISYLQKISGHTLQLAPAVPPIQAGQPAPLQLPPQKLPLQQPLQPQLQHQSSQVVRNQPSSSPSPSPTSELGNQIVRNQTSSSPSALVPVTEGHEVVVGGGAFEAGISPSRWPKSEVHALIKLRSGLDGRYQEAGPKGPLWEEISAGMLRLGYNRSSKRCKEKWENINKYFKKVKESNKKRPEDAKTCPYFHQLDALYRKRLLASGRVNLLTSMAPPQQLQQPHHPEGETKNNLDGGASSGGVQMQTSNGGGPPPSFLEEGSRGNFTVNKPEDIVKELMEQQATMDEPDSDNIDHEDDDYDDDEDEEDMKMQYKIQFQRQEVGDGGGQASAKATSSTTSGSFLAMVQ